MIDVEGCRRCGSTLGREHRRIGRENRGDFARPVHDPGKTVTSLCLIDPPYSQPVEPRSNARRFERLGRGSRHGNVLRPSARRPAVQSVRPAKLLRRRRLQARLRCRPDRRRRAGESHARSRRRDRPLGRRPASDDRGDVRREFRVEQLGLDDSSAGVFGTHLDAAVRDKRRRIHERGVQRDARDVFQPAYDILQPAMGDDAGWLVTLSMQNDIWVNVLLRHRRIMAYEAPRYSSPAVRLVPRSAWTETGRAACRRRKHGSQRLPRSACSSRAVPSSSARTTRAVRLADDGDRHGCSGRETTGDGSFNAPWELSRPTELVPCGLTHDGLPVAVQLVSGIPITCRDCSPRLDGSSSV